jgi:hypothetical protein
MLLPLKMMFSIWISKADGFSFSFKVPLKLPEVEHSHFKIPEICSTILLAVILELVLLEVAWLLRLRSAV